MILPVFGQTHLGERDFGELGKEVRRALWPLTGWVDGAEPVAADKQDHSRVGTGEARLMPSRKFILRGNPGWTAALPVPQASVVGATVAHDVERHQPR